MTIIYYIGFDVSHKERGRIDENYTELRNHLNVNGFTCYNFLEMPITRDVLNSYDILVFVCPDFAKISHQDILQIERWIKEDGGGLLLLSHAGGDRGRNSNLSELSEQFGIAFENDQVLDEENNIGMENMPIVDTFNPPHPITEGISNLCYRAGCSLSIVGSSYSIASSNESSEPFSCPLICVSEAGNGRVCAIGSYEMFRDETGGGFQYDDHSQLAQNVFNWLVSDYRAELRSQGSVQQPAALASESTQDMAASPETTQQEYSESQSINIDFTIKISTKSELMEMLKIFQNQINTIKDTIDKLIDKTEASEEEIAETRQATGSPAALEVPSELPDVDNVSVQEPTPDAQVEDTDIFGISNGPLSELPPKPPSLLKRAPNVADHPQVSEVSQHESPEPVMEGPPEIELPDEPGADQHEEPIPEEPSPDPVAEEVNEDELKAELEGLESKLNSVNNLINFIEKKFDSGKIDKKSYEKQKKKLERDLDKTNKRISEIKEKLN